MKRIIKSADMMSDYYVSKQFVNEIKQAAKNLVNLLDNHRTGLVDAYGDGSAHIVESAESTIESVVNRVVTNANKQRS